MNLISRLSMAAFAIAPFLALYLNFQEGGFVTTPERRMIVVLSTLLALLAIHLLRASAKGERK